MLILRRRFGILWPRRLGAAVIASAAGLSLVAWSGDQALAADSAACTTPPPSLLNGSFELPATSLSNGSWGMVAVGTPGLAWNTTDPTHVVEIWNSAAMGIGSPPAGARNAELNANNPAMLYQDLATIPGQQMVWVLHHRGRDGAETMRVDIGPPAGALVVQTPVGQVGTAITDGTSAWGTAIGAYTIPAGQTTTRFGFESVVPASGSQGNLLDGIEFAVTATACDDTAATLSGQSVTVPVRSNDQGAGMAASDPTTPAHGSVTMVAGSPRYTADVDYVGTDTFAYSLSDAAANTATARVTVTVTAPPLGTPSNETSVGVGTATQTKALTVPTNGQVRLLDASHNPVSAWTAPGIGTYSLQTSTGIVSFTPLLGYTGTPAGVGYRVTDRYAQTAEAAYTPTVTMPSPPPAPARTSSGVGTATQTQTLPRPSAGGVALLDANSAPQTVVAVPGEGTYALDAATGDVTFEPVLGFSGTATPRAYSVTDAYGQVSGSTYTATVSKPAGPTAAPQASTGRPAEAQARIVSTVAGGRLALLDDDGNEVQRLMRDGQGEYVLDAQQGVITFFPQDGFTGTPRAARFRITDTYGQSAEADYQPDVQTQAQAATVAPATVSKACFSRRAETIHWKVPAGQRLRWIKIAVAGERATSLMRSVRSVTVDLRGRPRQVVKLLITARTTKGRSLTQTRSYRTCSARMTHPPLPTLRLTPAARRG